jgi:hypothetical protein
MQKMIANGRGRSKSSGGKKELTSASVHGLLTDDSTVNEEEDEEVEIELSGLRNGQAGGDDNGDGVRGVDVDFKGLP